MRPLSLSLRAAPAAYAARSRSTGMLGECMLSHGATTPKRFGVRRNVTRIGTNIIPYKGESMATTIRLKSGLYVLAIKPQNLQKHQTYYPNTVLIWETDLKDARTLAASRFLWNDGFHEYFLDVADVDALINTKKIKKMYYGRSPFYSIDYKHLPKMQIFLGQHVKTLGSDVPGARFDIFNDAGVFRISRRGRSKSSILNPTFNSEIKAECYLRNSCSGI